MINPRTLSTYFFLVTLTLIGGMGLAILHAFMVNPVTVPLNNTDLQTPHQIQSGYINTHMQELFPAVVLFNLGVAIIILLFPVSWIWVVKYSCNMLTPASVTMKETVFFLFWQLAIIPFMNATPRL